VCVSTSRSKNECDRFLEQQINIKCVKLGKNTSDTCAVPSEPYGGKDTKNSSAFEGHKRYKEGLENVEDERNGRPRSYRTGEYAEKVQNGAFR